MASVWSFCGSSSSIFSNPRHYGYTSMFDCVIRESKRKCMVVQRRGLAKWFRMVTRCIYGWLSCSMPRFLVIRYGMKTDMASILDGHRRERESNFEERCIRRKGRRGVGGEPEIKWCALSIAIWFGRRNSSVFWKISSQFPAPQRMRLADIFDERASANGNSSFCFRLFLSRILVVIIF